mgnify:CR=1 FL=1
MPVFDYTGRNRRGEAVRGRLDGATPNAVADQLFGNGVTPIDIIAVRDGGDVLAGLRALRLKLNTSRIALTDQIFFCRQMYTLLKAGVPILQALRGLRDTSKNPALAKVIATIGDGLESGMDLTSAVNRHNDVFPPLFISMVQIGETTGSLPESFRQLAAYLDRERATRESIKQALRYPSMVLVAIGVAMVIINIFVVPAFAKIYAGFKAELPWATQVLIGVSNFSVKYWPIILLGSGLLALGVRWYVGTTRGRYRWHKLMLHLPLVGSLLMRATLGRFARALAITIKSGVPLVQGISVVSRAVDNDFVSARIAQMREGIERGESIMRTAAGTALFPPLVLQMIAVGEETGAVDDLLIEVADYYEREVDYGLKNLSSAIEPVLIVVIGIMVMILALGVFLPMWDLARASRGS